MVESKLKFCHKFRGDGKHRGVFNKKSAIPEFVKKVPVFCEFVE